MKKIINLTPYHIETNKDTIPPSNFTAIVEFYYEDSNKPLEIRNVYYKKNVIIEQTGDPLPHPEKNTILVVTKSVFNLVDRNDVVIPIVIKNKEPGISAKMFLEI